MANFDLLVEIIRDVCGSKFGAVEKAIRLRLGGTHVRIPGKTKAARRAPTDDDIRGALARHGWKIEPAARELGIHPATVYRRLAPKKPRPQPTDRLVR